MAEEKEKKPEEKKPEPVVEWGINLGGIFKGIGEFIDLASKLAEEGKTEVARTGEITFDKARKLRGMYGYSVRVGGLGVPKIERFGTVKPATIKPEVGEVREPLTDVFDEKEQVIVIAELPGVEEKDIKTELVEQTLKISAESKDRKYSKEVELPAAVTGEPETTYKNGVLEVKLKKKAE
jgi:HSP20 family protein